MALTLWPFLSNHCANMSSAQQHSGSNQLWICCLAAELPFPHRGEVTREQHNTADSLETGYSDKQEHVSCFGYPSPYCDALHLPFIFTDEAHGRVNFTFTYHMSSPLKHSHTTWRPCPSHASCMFWLISSRAHHIIFLPIMILELPSFHP